MRRSKINLVAIFITHFIYGVFLSENYGTALEENEKITLKVPQLSEEEMRSEHMPDHLKCDACLAISYQLEVALENRMKKKDSQLKESEILETIESVCESGFQEYGIKAVNSENRLSGPGLKTENAFGMTQMGGKWPYRLRQMCHNYVGENGEMEIYDAYKVKVKRLKDFLCYKTDCSHITQSPSKEL